MKQMLFALCFLTSLSQAQTPNTLPVAFETPFYEAVDRWVLFPDLDDEGSYPLGFLYIDQEAGFILDYETRLILEKGILHNPNSEKEKEHFSKVRLQRNTVDVHILNEQQLNDLNLDTPEWLEIYKEHSETDDYKISIASWYNNAGGNEIALGMLNDLYATNTTNEKLLFELSYAYNALGRHPEALKVLESALKVNDSEELFYKEQLYAFTNMHEFEAAKTGYTDYLNKSKSFVYLTETIYNLVYTHFLKKNREGFFYWSHELRSLKDTDPKLLDSLDLMELYWDEPRE